jgi:quinol monooxygenase YgiN
MATILAHINIHPGREAEWEALIRELYASTQAESGKLHYQYWRGNEPGLYYCLLAFEDFNSFIAHQTSDHHESASPLMQGMIAGMKLEWVDPVAGASDLPETHTQALPEGADELTAQYHELFAVDVAQWWAKFRQVP